MLPAGIPFLWCIALLVLTVGLSCTPCIVLVPFDTLASPLLLASWVAPVAQLQGLYPPQHFKSDFNYLPLLTYVGTPTKKRTKIIAVGGADVTAFAQ